MSKITKEDVLSTLAKRFTDAVRFADLAMALDLKTSQQSRLRRMLKELVEDGDVTKEGRGKYALVKTGSADVSGCIRVHPAGYGFVEREDGLGDVFVPAKFRGSAIDGDRVQLKTWEGYKGTEGKVEAVLERGRAKLTGVLIRHGIELALEPDDPRISTNFGTVWLDPGTTKGKEGQCVVVEISSYPSAEEDEIHARVVRVLGNPEEPHTEIEEILACEDIPVEFPIEVATKGKATPQEVSEIDLADRVDLRDRDFLTIDPVTARDFDDALCVEDGPNGGSRVWIAVADVSHYVTPDDVLDREAQVRGVSVYLPDRVIPMLPFELSSGICSLNPEVDRCAMVVRLDFDPSGKKIMETGFAAAVIRSRARMDYPGVAAALGGDFRGQRERYRKWLPNLKRLSEIASNLGKARAKRGTLALHVPEPKVVLDADDPLLVRNIVQAKEDTSVRIAYSLVEEFMIAANEAVGDFFESRELSVVWRVHATPDKSRVEELVNTLESYGVRFKADEALTPRGMNSVLSKVSETSASRSLSFLALRSLKQAVYSTDNIGHFGLASERYVHFTSPIRRYPDILVHRALKAQLKKEGLPAAGAPGGSHKQSELAEFASIVSAHERRAMKAEREAVSMYRAYFMRDQVGEVYEGEVSGLTNFGVFVQIASPFVEGLIKFSDLGGDRYELDPVKMRLVGKNTGFQLSLGDTVKVEIINVSVGRRQIDLRLEGAPIAKRPRRTKADARSRREPKGRTRTKTGSRRTSKGGAKPSSRKKAPTRGKKSVTAKAPKTRRKKKTQKR